MAVDDQTVHWFQQFNITKMLKFDKNNTVVKNTESQQKTQFDL